MWSGGVLQTKTLLPDTRLLLCGWVPKRPRGGGLLTYCVPNVPNVLNLNCVRRRYFHWQTHTGWVWVQSEFLPLHGSVAPTPPSWDPSPEFSSKAGRGRLHQWWQGAGRGSDLGWGAPPGSCSKGCWGLGGCGVCGALVSFQWRGASWLWSLYSESSFRSLLWLLFTSNIDNTELVWKKRAPWFIVTYFVLLRMTL